MNSVIARAKVITKVKDAKTHNQAGLIGGELKGLMKGLRANYDAAKAPLLAIQRALDNLFNELYKPLEEQYQRMDQVVSAFTDGLRREKEMEEAKAKAEADRKEAEAKARIAELERQREQERLRAKMTDDLVEKSNHTKAENKLAGQIESAQISLQLEKENVPLSKPDLPLPKAPGSSGFTRYEVEMVDEALVFAQHRDLLKIELRQGLAQALAKSLDDQGKPLSVPGLVIRKHSRTSFKGAAAIRIHGEESE